MARVQLNQNVHGGGAIISHRHILTSGFLLTIIPQPAVYIGGVTRTTQRQVPVQRIITHPQYQNSPRLNDIGLIELIMDITFDRFVQPANLPNFGTGLLPLENEQGLALGLGGNPQQINPGEKVWAGNERSWQWINLFTENLQAAFMRTVSPAHCQTRHPQHSIEQQFCAEDTRLRSDICANDLGGPFMVASRGTEILVGISSNFFCQTNQQLPSQPSIFTRVSTYRVWINQQTSV